MTSEWKIPSLKHDILTENMQEVLTNIFINMNRQTVTKKLFKD